MGGGGGGEEKGEQGRARDRQRNELRDNHEQNLEKKELSRVGSSHRIIHNYGLNSVVERGGCRLRPVRLCGSGKNAAKLVDARDVADEHRRKSFGFCDKRPGKWFR